MKFLIRWKRHPKSRREWLVSWMHNTESSSWWSEMTVKADSPEAAAEQIFRYVDLDAHTSYRDRRLRVRVYGPIPEESREFYVGRSTRVSPLPDSP